ncbi:MAG: sialidase family protein [Nitrosopumilus sp.]
MKTSGMLLVFALGVLLTPLLMENSYAEEIPSWVKNNAGWWASGDVSETDFLNAVEFLVSNGMIHVTSSTTSTTSTGSEPVPSWVKNNAGWWADGTLSDKEFLTAIEHLVETGIITVNSKSVSISTDGVFLVTQETDEQTDSLSPEKQIWERHAGHKDGIGAPGVAIDSFQNAIHVTYGDIKDGKASIFMKTSFDGGSTWNEPILVSEDGKGSMPHARPADVKMGPNGEIYVIYGHSQKSQKIWDLGFQFGFTDVYVARSIDGGKTFQQSLIADPQTSISQVGWNPGNLHSKSFESLFVDKDTGRIYVAWLDSRGIQNGQYAPTQVKMTHSDDGGKTFTPSVVIKHKACQCCATDMCKTDETMFVQYRNIIGNYGEPNYRDIVIATSEDGGTTWSPPTMIADDGFEIDNCPHAVSTITTDDNGNLHSAWYTMGGDKPGLYYATSTNEGKTWTYPLLVDSNNKDPLWFPATNIVIDIDSNGIPNLAWTNKSVKDNAVRHAQVIEGQVTNISDLGPGNNAWLDSFDGRTAVVWETSGKIMLKTWNDDT